ncbi:XRE family transcriptional regulator [Planobispora siamensis]|uniref:XRE family transcriptional regulator n=1 Tax=Planobispora siamensis TaxID=936338 RepID=A0A8J3WJM8_9ACTN|nr:XRE family transcriptional regulator [Planobispora siamensis]GIH91685.1 XRE family transcriptional regulator [Planobispora siamensis]
MNENLRHALIRARLQPVDVAARLAVDPKTVSRWVSGRIPHPRHRLAVADLLGTDEDELWPEESRGRRGVSGELKAIYPHRWAVPAEVWRSFFQAAEKEIGILVYSGLFLAEDTGILRVLVERARAGVRVRILLGDPDSPAVAARGAEEGVGGDVMAARVRNTLALFQPLQDVEGIDIRLHRTALYNSIYRADDDLLINLHAYGTRAPEAPVIYLTRSETDSMAATYLDSFERLWAGASPLPRSSKRTSR